MSEHENSAGAAKPRWIVPMKPRAPDEPHRVSTTLELFFDLVIVVAVAQAASGLHHGTAEGHIGATVVSYILIFFGIWWAWMNFTWFASSYDTDDVLYRVTVFVQMTGALILAAGVPSVFETRDLGIVVLGYVVMRVAMVGQWLRAAHDDPQHRPAALRYAGAIALVQVAWVVLLFTPEDLHVPLFILLALVEGLIPIWAERAAWTPWNLHHITERYGLFTIIVLGESILSVIIAVQTAVEEHEFTGGLIGMIVGALLIIFALWWLYFYQTTRRIRGSTRSAFIWAYSHWVIFAATAAVGAGLAVVIDQFTHHAEISVTGVELCVAVPLALYLICLWALQDHARIANPLERILLPLFAVLVLLTPLAGQTAVLLMGILLAALVVIRLVWQLE